MAKDLESVIYLPELNRASRYCKAGNDLARLVLSTRGNNGRIFSCASVNFETPDNSIAFQFTGDYRKNYPAVSGRATQKALEGHHSQTFTNSEFAQILIEVRAFYAAQK